MCDYTRYTRNSILWVVPDEEALPCKVAVQILVVSIYSSLLVYLYQPMLCRFTSY